ncbi:hypothetical protein [Glaesserella sp.]|uniref:hypothetical protein n=1 Tax=Glaesserella sp. TaxID=2094731 RepID=UPI0035A18DC5
MQKTKNRPKGRQLIPATKSFTQNSPIFIPLFLADPTQKRQIVWELLLESGEREAGKVKRNAISLPRDLPVGHHQLTVIIGKNTLSNGYEIFHCQLHIQSDN